MVVRKLAPEALYSSRAAREQRLNYSIREQNAGIHTYPGDVSDYDSAWDRAAENVRRIDPEGCTSFDTNS
mgnify:CR=1 FL=1